MSRVAPVADEVMREMAERHRMRKADFAAALPQLRVDVVNAQYELRRRGDFNVVIAVAGDDWLGVNGVLNRLNEWMDARLMPTYVFREPSDEDAARPYMWRLWRHLPPLGEMALYAGAAVQQTIAQRILLQIDDEEFDRRIATVNSFEKQLVDDGTVLLRFWITVPRHVHQQRVAAMGRKHLQRWNIRPAEWRVFDAHAETDTVVRRYLRSVASYSSPWNVVDGTQPRFRDYTVARAIADVVWERMAEIDAGTVRRRVLPARDRTVPRALDRIDVNATVDPEEYSLRMARAQSDIRKLSAKAFRKGVSSVLVFEGPDAGGKGGAIRRLTAAMEAGDYQVIQIAAPSDEEKARHYMWRFWRRLPAAGNMAIFDRSWYGRVLVERVEGFAREDEWERAYDEINDFEDQIVQRGIPVVKFWLQIDADEQLRRFQDREKTPYKKYKITEEDYRNREKWQAYEEAVDEMVLRTSPDTAPWHVVAANDKRNARVTVLETVRDALARVLN